MTNGLGISIPSIPQPPNLGRVYDNFAQVVDTIPNAVESIVNTTLGAISGLRHTLRNALRPPF